MFITPRLTSTLSHVNELKRVIIASATSVLAYSTQSIQLKQQNHTKSCLIPLCQNSILPSSQSKSSSVFTKGVDSSQSSYSGFRIFISQNDVRKAWNSFINLPASELPRITVIDLTRLANLITKDLNSILPNSHLYRQKLLDCKEQLRLLYQRTHILTGCKRLKRDAMFFNTFIFAFVCCEDTQAMEQVIQDALSTRDSFGLQHQAINQCTRNMILNAAGKNAKWIPLLKKYGKFLGFNRLSSESEPSKVNMECVKGNINEMDYTYSTILSYCIRMGKLQLGQYIVNKMLNSNHTFNLTSLTTLLTFLIESNQFQVAYHLVADIQQRHSHLDAVYYTILLRLYFKTERHDLVHEVLLKMQQEGLMDSQAYSEVIKGYFSQGGKDEMYQYIAKADEDFRRGCIQHYTMWMNLHFKRHDVSEALRVVEEIRRKEFNMDQVFFGSLIQGLMKSQQAVHGLRVFHFMQERGIQPNEHIYHILLSYLNTHGYLKNCESFFNVAKKHQMAEENLVSLMMRIYSMHGRLSDAIHVFKEFTKERFPSEVSAISVIKVLSQFGDVALTLKVYRELTEVYHVNPSETLLQSVLQGYLVNLSANPTVILQWLSKEMRRFEVSMSIHLLNMLLKIFLVRQQHHKAYQLYLFWMERGIKGNSGTEMILEEIHRHGVP